MTKGAFNLQDNSNERRLLSACLGKWQNDCSNETTCHYDERGINNSSHFWQMSYLKSFLFSNMTVHSFWRSPNLINTKGSKSKKLSIVSKIPQALPIRTQNPQNVAFSSKACGATGRVCTFKVRPWSLVLIPAVSILHVFSLHRSSTILWGHSIQHAVITFTCIWALFFDCLLNLI